MANKPNALAKPMRLGNITAKNRIWMAPLWTRTAAVTGEVSANFLEHYRARAKGGAGLIAHEAAAIDGRHTWVEPQLRIDDNQFIPGLSRLVEAVHAYNTPIICQLHHAGMFGRDPVSPSGVPASGIGGSHYTEPRALSLEEVKDMRDMFIAAAVRAQQAGYDGVELHGATAYLLEQFFSPHNNKRCDRYGGSLEARMRLPLEIVSGIRKACGPAFVLGYTAVDSDLVEGGIGHEENLAFAKALENEGITYLDLQGNGTYETFHLAEAPGSTRSLSLGQFDIAQKYKKALGIPVTTRASGQTDPAVWEAAIGGGEADAVRLGRLMLCDPDVAKKVLAGKPEEVRSCIRCGNCQFSGVITSKYLSCTVNPGMGFGEPEVLPAPKQKEVLVVGGGPAGLEAARTSALRGHAVTLVEKSGRLGGNQYIGSLPVAKQDLSRYVGWAELQCKNLGVDIRMNTPADAAFVKDFAPDTLFIATGSRPVCPPIPGGDGEQVVMAEEVLQNPQKLGDSVVVLGGGEVGLETADFILDKGLAQRATVVEMLPDVGMDMSPMDKGSLFVIAFPKFFGAGRLQIHTGSEALEITAEGVQVLNLQNGASHLIEADSVVLACGYQSDGALQSSLASYDGECYVLGDAAKPRRILEAIHQASQVAARV